MNGEKQLEIKRKPHFVSLKSVLYYSPLQENGHSDKLHMLMQI